MSDVRLERIAEVMREVEKDCRADASTLDGKPFEGSTVAEQFGNCLAAIAAVARAVEVLATRADSPSVGAISGGSSDG